MKNSKINLRKLSFSLLLIALVYSLPLFIRSQYIIRVCVYITIYSILSCSLNLISGVAGQVSMGHAAFYGIGAYASALFAMKLGVPWVICVFLAAIISGIVGTFLAIPALRLKGGYLVICTSGFCELVRLIMLNWVSLTRGPMGITNIPRPVIFGVKITTNTQYYFVSLTLFLLIFIFLRNILNSKYGRNLRAIKEDELAAEAMGIHTHREKVTAFGIASALAGMAGSMLAHYMIFISPTLFTGDFSTQILSMVVLGGMGSMPGSVVATALLTAVPELLRGLNEYRMLIYGFLLIFMMLGKNVDWQINPIGKYFLLLKDKSRSVYFKLVGEV